MTAKSQPKPRSRSSREDGATAVFIALLRAANVGGTGKLPMSDLKRLCAEAGFKDVRTYIASGNVVLKSGMPATQVKAALEKKLHAYAGKPVAVLVRSAAELADVLKRNPFPKATPNRTIVFFLDQAPPRDTMKSVTGRKDEELRLGKREIYIHYPSGMGRSKLKIPGVKTGTARNLNTVAKLAAMANAAET